MKTSFQDRCGYKKESWNNLYYPILSYVWIFSVGLSILSERWFPAVRELIDTIMIGSNLSLIIYCAGVLRKELCKFGILNLTTCGYILLYTTAMFLLYYLLHI